jgi:hypothetical protein
MGNRAWRLPSDSRFFRLDAADYQRGTKDSDVLETAELQKELAARLTLLAGKGTELHLRRRIYLDVTDVAVSKLKRFIGSDRNDIAAMIERGLVPHALFVERFKSAVESYYMDARAEDLPKYIRNFHQIERDDFDVEETEIELPSWI